MTTESIKILEDMLGDIEHLINKTNEMYIPVKYHTTSLKPEAMCDLSYQTGRRDQMHSQRCQIEWALGEANKKFETELERNHQEHLKDEANK
tara:strand:- start:217 stop:492 length:276 start_codon:yes stop_codon:yes gene_type:complete